MNKYEQRQAQRRERLEDAADKARAESNTVYRRARQMADVIPFGQPILVGHHSEGRDRRYRARIHSTFGKSFALQEKADRLAQKAASVGTGGISSDDPDAVVKLQKQLDDAKAGHERMKKVNRVIRDRAGDEDAQIDGLLALGWLTNDQARDLVMPDFCGRVGFPSYALQNSNANIRRIEQRIRELQKAREATDVEIEADGYTYREDVEDNRACFIFPGKPDEATRQLLKRYGFRWSPSREGKPWVRQLTGNARYAAQCVREALDRQAGNLDA